MADKLYFSPADKLCFSPADTLFLSDLDGTLLTRESVLPEGAAEKIRALCDHGVHLTYATARTIRSAAYILAGVPYPAPVSLMNGTFLRDMVRGVYLKKHVIDRTAAEEIAGYPAEPFIYTLDETDELFTAYRRLANPAMAGFMRERIERYNKPFCKLDTGLPTGVIVYFCYLAAREELLPLYEMLRENPAVQCTFYPDHQYPETWYLEVFAADASKGNAVRELREVTGCKTIVAFGDNYNDLPMLRAADYAVAMETAPEEVRAAADAVVEPGMGVLHFIKTHTMCEPIR